MKTKRKVSIFSLFLVTVYLLSLFTNVLAADTKLLSSIEINQVLGYDISNTDGSVSLIDNFVAGKQTGIFVPLSSDMAVDRTNETQSLLIKYNGEEIATLYPTGEKASTNLLEFIPKNMDDVGGWKAGTYEFTAKVGEESISRTVEFKETKVLHILAVPVKANYGGDIRLPGDRWKTAYQYLTTVYPVAQKGIDWEEAPLFDCSDAKYDLKTDAGCENMWKALCDLQVKDQNGNDKYTLIIGFVKDRQGPSSSLQGFTYGKPANIVTESDEDMLATVPHEIAHCYEVGDEYSGGTLNPKVNIPPFGMEGKAWDGSTTVKGDKEFVKGDAEKFGEGTIIPAYTHPFEYGGRGLMGDKVSYMGSGGKQENYWTTSAIYNHLFNSLLSASNTQSENPGTPMARMAKESKTRIIEATGWIGSDGSVTLDPWYSEEYYDQGVKSEQGAYSIEALDKDGKVLAAQGFDVTLYSPASNKSLEKAPFDVLIHFPDGTKSFAIKKGTQVLKTITVSASAPVISISSPQTAETVSGKQTVTWSGSDADNDKLTYEVWYTPDGNDWTVLGTNLDKTSLEIDFDELPGSDSAVISVLATDGINTTEATLSPIKVAFKAPEIRILEPEETTQVKKYSSNEEIWFSADVYDPQDGMLEDDQVVWTDSEGTVLGDSPELYYGPNEISPGTYEITVTAKNSKGLTSTKTFTIEVVPSAIQVLINGKPLTMDTNPVIVDGRTLVPLRAIFEAIGATVSWDGDTSTVTSIKGSTTISLTIGSTDATVNGVVNKLDVPATIINDRTMVPVRFVSESLGAKVSWDEATSTVVIGMA